MNRNRTNFSKEQKNLLDLTLDLSRGDFSLHVDKDKVSRKDLENHLRDTINKDILKGATLFQAMRRNNLVMFEIMEEIVNVTIGEDVMNSPFMESFVEIKNRALGDTSVFYSEGGLYSVASFAGNHWDTNRQAMDLGTELSLSKEWCYIHLYEDLERFLLGIGTLDKLMDKIYKSVNKFFQDRIYAMFQNVANSVPTEFTRSGNSEEALGELCDLVMSAGGYSSLTIAGTKSALRKLVGIVPDKTFADSQKEAKANTGSIGMWEGNKLMVIPQTLKSGTFELALDEETLFILDGDCKPIKLEFEGDTRTMSDTTGKAYNDGSIDFQIQTKFGMGLALPPYFGVFKFA